MNKIAVVLAVTTPLFLVACGGGGGSTAEPTPTTPVPTTPTPTTPTPTTPTPTTPSGPKDQTINPLYLYSLSAGSAQELKGKSTSGLPVSYTSTTPSICSVSGSTLTGLAVGDCTISISQAGNADFNAAPSITSSVPVTEQIFAQAITDLSVPALIIGGVVTVSPQATSGLPILIESLTPSICETQNRLVFGIAVGTCTLTASQGGNSRYSPAPVVSASGTVVAANTALAATAWLAPWMTTPQSGSTTADTSAVLEGIYSNAVGAHAMIDGGNKFVYNDSSGSLLGQFSNNATNWSLNSSSTYFASSTTGIPIPGIPAIAKGTFVTKTSMTSNSQSFPTKMAHLGLSFDKSNGYAASQSSVAGTWIFDDTTYRFVLNISSTGVITGSETNAYKGTSGGGVCNLSGSIVQAEPGSQHNMYKVTLNVSGTSCTDFQKTEAFTGLASLRFNAAGTVESNGYIPFLFITLVGPTTGDRMPLILY